VRYAVVHRGEQLLFDFISPAQHIEIIDIIFTFLNKNNHAMACKMLHHFKEALTETHYENIRALLKKHPEGDCGPYSQAQYIYLSLLLPAAEQAPLKDIVTERRKKMIHWLLSNFWNFYDKNKKQDEAVQMAELLIRFSDLIPEDNQNEIVNTLISPLLESQRTKIEPCLSTCVQLLMLKDFFPRTDFQVNYEVPLYSFPKPINQPKLLINVPKATKYLIESLINGLWSLDYEKQKAPLYDDALKLMHYTKDLFPKELHEKIMYILGNGCFSRIKNNDLRDLSSIKSLLSWLDKIDLDEHAVLLTQLMHSDDCFNLPHVVLSCSLYHRYQDKLKLLSETPDAKWAQPNEETKALYTPSTAEELVQWNSKATMIQALVRKKQAQPKLTELKEEQREGKKKQTEHDATKIVYLEQIQQIEEAIKHDDLPKAHQLVTALNDYASQRKHTEVMLSDIDKRRFGLFGYAHLTKKDTIKEPQVEKIPLKP
jgi:hypothetical protein